MTSPVLQVCFLGRCVSKLRCKHAFKKRVARATSAACYCCPGCYCPSLLFLGFAIAYAYYYCSGLLLAHVSVWTAGHLSREREGLLRRKVVFGFLGPQVSFFIRGIVGQPAVHIIVIEAMPMQEMARP